MIGQGSLLSLGPALSRRGFSFAWICALMLVMDPDLENVIRQALADARSAGRDHLGQTELAVQMVMQARPDLTASEALAAVSRVGWS